MVVRPRWDGVGRSECGLYGTLEVENLACSIQRGDVDVQGLGNGADAGYLLGARDSESARADPQRILEGEPTPMTMGWLLKWL